MTKPTTSKQVPLPHLHHTESEMKLLHRMTGTAGAALREDPDWSSAAQGLAAVADALAQLRSAAPTDPAALLVDELTKAALAGEPIKLLDLASVHAERATARELAARAVTAAQRRLEDDLGNAARRAVPRMFDAVASEFAALWCDLRAVDEVDQLATAEQAIAADRAHDWTRWCDLLARNTELRREQALLIKRAGLATGVYPETLVLAAPDQVWPRWALEQTNGRELVRDNGDIEHLVPPWPVDDRGALSLNVAASDVFVRWALTADVTPRIPTPNQIRDESTRLAALLATGAQPVTKAARRREANRVAATMHTAR